MKIATWNVNSLNVRIEHVLEWIAYAKPDILALQEIKQPDEMFPLDAFKEIGYHAVSSGQKTYNGVAVITKEQPKNIITDFSGFDDLQRRILITEINNVRIMNLYIPNGQNVESDKYIYKLAWLNALIAHIEREQDKYKDIIILGDFNIAPEDRDVYDAEKWGEDVLCSPKEREALEKIIALGFCDVFRKFDQEEKQFSWWDYRAASFRRNAGVRIDLILASESLKEKCEISYIDREPRTWERPSDHTPVIAEFNI